MKIEQYVSANRSAWNQSASSHRHSEYFDELISGFSTPGYSFLSQTQDQWVRKTGFENQRVAQVCCNNGREILSIKNMGAASCTGFDISSEFLAQARELAQIGQIDCEFVETNIYEIPAHYYASFHVVIITIGVFGWMPDLPKFFDVVSQLLVGGGHLLIHEEHPIMNMFEPEVEDPLMPRYSYFKDAPFEENESIVYDGSDRQSTETHYWFVHPISKVVSCCINAGLTICEFEEYPHNISNVEFDIYQNQDAQLPMSYMLLSTK